ncbi:MAG TPA: hypothetical protein DIS88_03510 [Prevotella sp.]|nr:hypothetical protein [Prevotella sp.]
MALDKTGCHSLDSIVSHAFRCRGQFCEETASRPFLHVNRCNKAKTFYDGMKVSKQGDYDIGNGYFMNNYMMEKVIYYYFFYHRKNVSNLVQGVNIIFA